MEISYKSKKLRRQLTETRELVKAYGKLARKIDQRLEELRAAETLNIMKRIPAAKCHQLTGEREGQLAVKLSGNWRLVFEPDHTPIPQKDEGGLDWEVVTAVKILVIEDYH